MKPPAPASAPSSSAELAVLCGEAAESFSFNRSVGQIYGLLFASSRPLSLQEISVALHMSKGNASVNLRVLEGWEAVRQVGIPGSRQDHYEANRDIKGLIVRRVQDGLSKRLDHMETRFAALGDKLESAKAEDLFLREQIKSLRDTLGAARRALSLLPKLTKWLP